MHRNFRTLPFATSPHTRDASSMQTLPDLSCGRSTPVFSTCYCWLTTIRASKLSIFSKTNRRRLHTSDVSLRRSMLCSSNGAARLHMWSVLFTATTP
eukprot:2407197-Pleurochrysis_carterae.AAC.1